MSTIPVWTFHLPELIASYNRAKDVTLDALVKEGLMKQDQADEWRARHAIVIHKNSWFGNLWEKVRGQDQENSHAIHMMALPPEERNSNAGTDGTREAPGADDLARFNPNQES